MSDAANIRMLRAIGDAATDARQDAIADIAFRAATALEAQLPPEPEPKPDWMKPAKR